MKNTNLFLYGIILVALLFFGYAPTTQAAIDDCPAGYEWQRMSGVGCVQINCATVPDGHYSYTSQCICGSSGSEWENAADPNKECNYSHDYASCPNCLYACVHLNEECPAAPGDATTNTNTVSTNKNINIVLNSNTAVNTSASANQNVNLLLANTALPSLSMPAITNNGSCTDECNKYLRDKKNAVVVSAEGVFPDCQCQIDVRDENGTLTQTISSDGPVVTTYTYDSSGALTDKSVINRTEEVEKVRKRLGYKYTEEQIDKLLDPTVIDKWFQDQTGKIVTATGLSEPQFWWQHFVAVLDHGFGGNSADFVDTHNFGRCGDSMQWLERDLVSQLHLGDDPEEPGQKHEAILSITGEKYGNFLNHTSILVRPAGITNSEWEDIVKELKKLSGGQEDNPGIQPNNLQNVDPRLMDAKVLDPYKKQITTVREFIKGWSYIRIS
ncbi:MAG: hypothetical protein WCV50_01310 [Patescibacteria group bacterium]|jgi:hypothetical protein